jgi:thioredoxin reductase
MIHKEIVVVGAGPAGLSAAITAAEIGASVLLVDENRTAGGQLFKQIHKFFGSKEHRAGIRGFRIGMELLNHVNEQKNIQLWLNTQIVGVNKDKELWAIQAGKPAMQIKADIIILATGAIEKPIHFPGWTLPGVMGAGAAQTMMNIYNVLPGKRVVMIGSGNVGVIVAYQLLQAGAEVVGILEASPQLGGYGVHTAKVCRAGVPFFSPYTLKKAIGRSYVEAAEIIQLDSKWQSINGTERILEADLICLATGFTPLTELAWMSDCKFTYIPELGGHVPIHNTALQTTIPGIYIAGDISGIEEASTAMEEGRMAGTDAAFTLGYLSKSALQEQKEKICERLNELRSGPMDVKRKLGKEIMFETYNKERI